MKPCGSGFLGFPSPSPLRGSPPSPGALSGSTIRLTPSAQTKFVREAGEGICCRGRGDSVPFARVWVSGYTSCAQHCVLNARV
ncbi:hypothetical protein FZ942_35150 [Azospirillum lipoferum]|uniref:Uncharacterized protein n=1 Tax=Azospirillum lipoferum TaxID=193 RepID=A0A5A9FY11_AZOLI|nr:hypothetical protein FZ942_35150 [Azospirillum lipoferum]